MKDFKLKARQYERALSNMQNCRLSMSVLLNDYMDVKGEWFLTELSGDGIAVIFENENDTGMSLGHVIAIIDKNGIFTDDDIYTTL